MMVKADFDIPDFYQQIVLDELNVKSYEATSEADSFVDYTFKPQMRTVGPKYGKLLGGIKKALTEIDGKAAMAELNEKGELTLDINGSEVVLTRDDSGADEGRPSDRDCTDGRLCQPAEWTAYGCSGHQSDRRADRGRICQRTGIQDPDNAQGSRIRGHGPYQGLCGGQ